MSRKLRAHQSSTGRHFILRHWEPSQIVSGEAWAKRNSWDGFITDVQYNDTAVWAGIVALTNIGKLFWRYFGCIEYPYAYWDFGGPDFWRDYMRHTWQFSGSSPGSASNKRMLITGSPNKVGLFSRYHAPWGDYEHRELIPWNLFSEAEAQTVADEAVDYCYDLQQTGTYMATNAGAFCDMTWMQCIDWMNLDYMWLLEPPQHVDATHYSGHGNTSEPSDPYTGLHCAAWADLVSTHGGASGTWSIFQSRQLAFLARIATKLAAKPDLALPHSYTTIPYRITNGAHGSVNGQTIPYPWYLENAWNNPEDGDYETTTGSHERWTTAKTTWIADKRNVLNATFTDGVGYSLQGGPNFIWQFYDKGGWISFKDDGSVVGTGCTSQALYEAERVRAGYSYSKPSGEGSP